MEREPRKSELDLYVDKLPYNVGHYVRIGQRLRELDGTDRKLESELRETQLDVLNRMNAPEKASLLRYVDFMSELERRIRKK